MDYRALLEEQIELLAEWNKKNMQSMQPEPEQVRKNSETILNAIQFLWDGPSCAR